MSTTKNPFGGGENGGNSENLFNKLYVGLAGAGLWKAASDKEIESPKQHHVYPFNTYEANKKVHCFS